MSIVKDIQRKHEYLSLIEKEKGINKTLPIETGFYSAKDDKNVKKGNAKGFEQGSYGYLSIFNTRTPKYFINYSYPQYREDYFKVPAVHSCINGIAREISNMKWAIIPRDDNVFVPKALIPRAIKFFQRPNRNKRPFSQLIYVMVKDLLLYGSTGLENVINGYGRLTEIYPRDGSTIVPVTNIHGSLLKYIQIVGSNEVEFSLEEMVFIEFNPDTYSPGGSPILDGLKDVCQAIKNAIEFLSLSLNYNQIPPGILSAPNLTQDRANDIAKSMKALRDGAAVDYEFVPIGGVPELKWLELKKENKESFLIKELDGLEREVFRAFGVTPIEAGEIQDVNRASAMIQANIGQSKMIKPIVDLLADEINEGTIWAHMSDKIKMIAEPNVQRTRDVIIAEGKQLIRDGVRSINEQRKLLGEKAIKGGDNHIVTVGGTFVKVADFDKDVSEIKAFNVSQPDKNRNQDQNTQNKDNQKTNPEEGKNKIKEIITNRQDVLIKGIINEYFNNNGKIGNLIKSMVDSFYFKIKESIGIEINPDIILTNINKSIKSFEKIKNRKKYLDDDGFKAEKTRLYKKLEDSFKNIIEDYQNELF